MTAIGVVGAGAWGVALAQLAAAGGPVRLWARDPTTVAAIAATRTAPRLPGRPLLPAVRATANLADLAGCDALLIVVPVTATAAVLAGLAGLAPRPLVLCAKGLGPGGVPLTEVAAAALPGWPLALLSGPTFAEEVAAGLPAAATLACTDADLAARLAARLGRPHFRLYTGGDVVGVGLGGAVKNVLAVAAGVVAGRGLGENARAAIVTRGFAEMRRYGAALGGDPATLAGLSGLGDLVLTCSGARSRNFALGEALGRGVTAAAALAASRGVAEGAATAPILAADARARGIDLPIAAAVADLVAGAGVDAVIARLLDRPRKSEG
ncbi:MAG: NAD(P)H-dependent glycerol-3-phosphate dehydrogenase [Sphingomonadaceae bacterium]|nr:NAD(P)H-dependent glycerol-3-phosphate dehydrogenase [Sphingomonadaceae bacterium]